MCVRRDARRGYVPDVILVAITFDVPEEPGVADAAVAFARTLPVVIVPVVWSMPSLLRRRGDERREAVEGRW